MTQIAVQLKQQAAKDYVTAELTNFWKIMLENNKKFTYMHI